MLTIQEQAPELIAKNDDDSKTNLVAKSSIASALPLIRPAFPPATAGWFGNAKSPLFESFAQKCKEFEMAYQKMPAYFQAVLNASMTFVNDATWGADQMIESLVERMMHRFTYEAPPGDLLTLSEGAPDKIHRALTDLLARQGSELLQQLFGMHAKLARAELIGTIEFRTPAICECRAPEWIVGGPLKGSLRDHLRIESPELLNRQAVHYGIINVVKKHPQDVPLPDKAGAIHAALPAMLKPLLQVVEGVAIERQVVKLPPWSDKPRPGMPSVREIVFTRARALVIGYYLLHLWSPKTGS